MHAPPRPAITVLALGRVTTESTENLVRRVGAIEQIDLRLDHDAAISAHAAEINRGLDAASCDWVVIVRAHESITERLATEIAESIGASPRAWGYRLRTQTVYCGAPLRLEAAGEGELRLLHRRHARFVPGGEANVQGTVIRASEPILAHSFASAAEHEQYLSERGSRRRLLGRIFVFAVDALRSGPLRAGANGLRYLWVSSGWRRGGRAPQ